MSAADANGDLEESIEYPRASGAAEVRHSNRTLLDHLIGTREQLLGWGARPSLCNAGLFHSVYGTEHFRSRTIPLSMRKNVQDLIGNEAEHLVWLFCFMRRKTFNDNITRQSEWRVQTWSDDQWHLLTREQFHDLANLTVTNALEALPHLPWYERQRLRRAYKRYLSQLNGVILADARHAVDAACVPWWNFWT